MLKRVDGRAPERVRVLITHRNASMQEVGTDRPAGSEDRIKAGTGRYTVEVTTLAGTPFAPYMWTTSARRD